jgi:hypothetical protein
MVHRNVSHKRALVYIILPPLLERIEATFQSNQQRNLSTPFNNGQIVRSRTPKHQNECHWQPKRIHVRRKPLTFQVSIDDDRARSLLVVGGAFTCLFCTVGFLNSAGIFLEYYARDILSNESPSTIAWISAIAIFFLFAMSPGAGAMLDASGPTVRLT